MATPSPSSTSPAPAPPLARALLADPLWHAPLVPIALAYTVGVVLDRHTPIPFPVTFLAACAGLLAWFLSFVGDKPRLGVVYLGLTVMALAAAYHHWHCRLYAADDIGNFVDETPRPARLRGVLEEEPFVSLQPPDDPFTSVPRGDATMTVLAVTDLRQGEDWVTASGRVRVRVAGRMTDLHVGDEVDVMGRLSAPRGPSNPGEFDYAAHLRDQRIRAVLTFHAREERGVVRLGRGWPNSPRGWLAVLRGHCRGVLEETIPEGKERALAVALLLGDGSAMTAEAWEKYIRTGVVQVLVVSGQHLAVLGWFLWFVLRRAGFRGRTGAVVVALVLLTYSLLVGGQPPVMRSAVMACVVCGGLLLRRPAMTANTFALSWLVVGVLNPTDLCGAGCQLSFLCVALLTWGIGRGQPTEQDPLDRLADDARPQWRKRLLRAGRQFATTYGVSLALWLAVAPLVAGRYHMISTVGAPITPPVVLLTSVALLTGFAQLLLAPVCGPLAWPFAWVTRWCLGACDWLVDLADAVPHGCWYVGDMPDWWLWTFYVGLLVVVMVETLRRYWRRFALAGLAWLVIGLAGGAAPRTSDELRCSFLAVGHGGCSVIETPDGRTLLYDAGALGGPDVTRRQIAPFLWHRGIRRVDEVFLSHADLDHFNGLPALLDRFAVGQVTCTPSFFEKNSPAVRLAKEAVEKRGVPVRRVRAGDRLTTDAVDIEVLHPPAQGPPGNENARSLVLRVTHAGHSLLLTGDLEGAGLERVLKASSAPVDVLMAPHHGSKTSNTPELAAWARPKVVVACQGAPRLPGAAQEPYSKAGARFLDTWSQGAVTVRSHETGVVVETFRTSQQVVIRGRRP